MHVVQPTDSDHHLGGFYKCQPLHETVWCGSVIVSVFPCILIDTRSGWKDFFLGLGQELWAKHLFLFCYVVTAPMNSITSDRFSKHLCGYVQVG